MKYLGLLFVIVASSAFGQTYFQQEVNYTIDVTLDDKNHVLRGFEEFEYVNNSPSALDKIYIHLWPNAYKNGETALGKQSYQDGDDYLEYGNDSIKGNIDSLDFKLNRREVSWHYDQENPDICVLELPIPLKSGERISISTPFRVKIPSGDISRLGHVGESYQITQWYPKPAVFDKDGWHPMPYLGQGEFYSEFGSFDVQITLPENYIVGATGDLQTESEISFLNKKAKETKDRLGDDNGASINKRGKKDEFPASSETTKTIRYTQKNVHDFAWFADKRYYVLKGEVKLPHSERTVTSWAMYTPRNEYLWKNAIEYINDATYYYSLWNGDYPYDQVTAVDGTISAGGGMEYPNVTVIGNSATAHQLEVVIVHEVGHNWFYGQLGSNERVHGWMDEGMNTLNEVRYMQTKYPGNTKLSDMVLNGKFHFDNLDYHDTGDMSYRAIAAIGEDQPIETHSAEFTSMNYGIVMYQKTGLVFFYLKAYLGEDLFNKCMHEYYNEWEFKHPSPSDMRSSLEKTSGKDLSWLFEDLINTTHHVDYKILSSKLSKTGRLITVKNVGQVNGPIPVSIIENDSTSQTYWIEPTDKRKRTLSVNGSQRRHVIIDQNKDIPELNRKNNELKASGLFKKIEKPTMEFLIGDNERGKSNNFWMPFFAGNKYDKFMLGAMIHNVGVPPGKMVYFAAPMYSFGRQMVSGVADINVNYTPRKQLKLSRFGVSVKSFKHDSNFRGNESYYIGILPYWFAKLGNRDKKAVPYTQNIRVQGIYRKDQFGPLHIEHAGGFASYDFNYSRRDHRVNFQLRNELFANLKNDTKIGRILVESTYKIRYNRKKDGRWAEIRGFFGNQYLNDHTSSEGQFTSYQYSMSLSGSSGSQDLFLDEYYFGRNEPLGYGAASQVRDENMGGFRSTSSYGTTQHWMTSGNLWLQLPYIPKFFGVFADAGAFYNGSSIQTSVNTGLGIRVAKRLGVYFPIWMNSDLDSSFGELSYWHKIRFTLKLNILNKPFKISNFI
ncbi:MAG: M1 family metallopeptidase [Crocinitomicaceae bacterium]|nr:M1 family metallopeptidase [Crocinitomicaceae bacterium]